MKRALIFSAFLLSGATAASLGPARGNLVIVGGGTVGAEIVSRFIALAGGPEAPFVWVPMAGEGEPKVDMANTLLAKAGVQHIKVLHTRDRKVAVSEVF